MAEDPFAVGDEVRLRRAIDTFPVGTRGKVIGFMRVDPEQIVIAVRAGTALQLRPEDVEHAR